MSAETLTRILDLARWAPSGDNTQPWRFSLVGNNHIRVFGNDTRDHILYDFDGHASHLAHGALLETIRIAATGFGLNCSWQITSDAEQREPIYDVQFSSDAAVTKSPLFEHIERRVVQRRPMKTVPLTPTQRAALANAGGNDVQMQLFEGWSARWAVGKLLWKSAKIRLTCKEAYSIHKEIIEWRAQFSADRIPDQAVGVDPATARLMEWAMASWERVHFMNRFLGGTIVPRLQLDLIPALLCAAHMLVLPKKQPSQLEDWVSLGATWQRIWLTATQLGLHMQPELTPVIFRWYARSGRRFSKDPTLSVRAEVLASEFERLAGANTTDPFGFFCRIGNSVEPTSRSIRKNLRDLMY